MLKSLKNKRKMLTLKVVLIMITRNKGKAIKNNLQEI